MVERPGSQTRYTASVEAKLDAVGVSVDVTSFHFPPQFDSDILRFPKDVLLLRLGTAPKAQVRVGNTTSLEALSRLGALSFWPAGSYLQVSYPPGGHFRGVNCVFQGAWFRDLMDLVRYPGEALPVCTDIRNDRLVGMLHTLVDELS